MVYTGTSFNSIMTHYFLSTSCFIINLDEAMSLQINQKVINIYQQLINDKQFLAECNIYDIVPSYNSIAFHFNNLDLDEIYSKITTRVSYVDVEQKICGKTHYIDTIYDGIDMSNVCEYLGLSRSDVIKKHTQAEYYIAMLGFKPYFPYLLGMDDALSVPRLSKPRNKVAKGSIGIGGSQTAIFTVDTPSGWNIIANTGFRCFDKFSPGDKIIFREVK